MMDILRCLLLPIQDKILIVPYSAVAEVISYEDIKVLTKSDNWIVGEFSWRGIQAPLICLERQDKPDFQWEPNKMLHVAILNRSTESPGPDFIGLLLQGLPSMNRFKRSDIQAVSPSDKLYLSQEVSVREKTVFIPNLNWIHDNLAEFHPTLTS